MCAGYFHSIEFSFSERKSSRSSRSSRPRRNVDGHKLNRHQLTSVVQSRPRNLVRHTSVNAVGPQAEWAEHVCSAPQLDVSLFSDRQGIIYGNAEVSNGALDLSVTQPELYGA